MKTLGMFITMSFLINETGQAKDLQDLTLANDTITESIIQAGGQKKALPADTAYRKKTTDIVKAKIAQQSSRISPAVKDFQALLYNFRRDYQDMLERWDDIYLPEAPSWILP